MTNPQHLKQRNAFKITMPERKEIGIAEEAER